MIQGLAIRVRLHNLRLRVMSMGLRCWVCIFFTLGCPDRVVGQGSGAGIEGLGARAVSISLEVGPGLRLGLVCVVRSNCSSLTIASQRSTVGEVLT